MDLYLAAALIALAALIAAGVTRLAVRGRTNSAVERALAESGQQRAKLQERLDARDRDVVRLESELAARGRSLEDESTRTADLRTRMGSLETLLVSRPGST